MRSATTAVAFGCAVLAPGVAPCSGCWVVTALMLTYRRRVSTRQKSATPGADEPEVVFEAGTAIRYLCMPASTVTAFMWTTGAHELLGWLRWLWLLSGSSVSTARLRPHMKVEDT